MRTARRTPWLIGLGAAIFLLLGSRPTRAQTYVAGALDHPHIVWLKVGFTSERRFFFGASFESVVAAEPRVDAAIASLTAGIEVSPHSEIAVVRLFGTLNGAVGPLTSSCEALLLGGSAGPVFTIGPRSNHVGLRLGARFAYLPLAYSSDSEPVTGFSYGLSWLPKFGHVHDFDFDVGETWAARGDCESD